MNDLKDIFKNNFTYDIGTTVIHKETGDKCEIISQELLRTFAGVIRLYTVTVLNMDCNYSLSESELDAIY